MNADEMWHTGEELDFQREQQIREETIHQLNEHFLMNALTVIMVMDQKEPAQAKVLQREFGYYLRGVLTQAGGGITWIPLEQEWQVVEAYLHIQQVRFMDRIQYECVMTDTDALVPEGMLRTLVENAVKHGLCKKGSTGHVWICQEIECHKQHLYITDDGAGFDTASLKDLKRGGICRTRSYLEKLEGAALYVESAPGAGTRAELVLPLDDLARLKAGERL
jgi:LytS/YehU family sensor histidine kinase